MRLEDTGRQAHDQYQTLQPQTLTTCCSIHLKLASRHGQVPCDEAVSVLQVMKNKTSLRTKFVMCSSHGKLLNVMARNC